jgi:hypothetical protein
MYHARPSLHTVFSITQSDHVKLPLSAHDNTDLEMMPEGVEFLGKDEYDAG